MDVQDRIRLLELAGFTLADTDSGTSMLAGSTTLGVEWSVEATDSSTGGPPTPETVIFKGKVFGSEIACDLIFESADPRDMVALMVSAANAVAFGIHSSEVPGDRGFRFVSHGSSAGLAAVFIHNPFAEHVLGDWTGIQEADRDFVLDDPTLHYGRDYLGWRDGYCQALLEPGAHPSM